MARHARLAIHRIDTLENKTVDCPVAGNRTALIGNKMAVVGNKMEPVGNTMAPVGSSLVDAGYHNRV